MTEQQRIESLQDAPARYRRRVDGRQVAPQRRQRRRARRLCWAMGKGVTMLVSWNS